MDDPLRLENQVCFALVTAARNVDWSTVSGERKAPAAAPPPGSGGSRSPAAPARSDAAPCLPPVSCRYQGIRSSHQAQASRAQVSLFIII